MAEINGISLLRYEEDLTLGTVISEADIAHLLPASVELNNTHDCFCRAKIIGNEEMK